ncbi:hypothetical protein GQ600_18366 [Phytophthora cactorum]|nr:hypothetical protein GQ600_18366 [Phytophthora cactorum]
MQFKAFRTVSPIHGIDNLITAVQAAYKDMSADTLDNIFLTLKDCMRCVLHQKDQGGADLEEQKA